MIFKTPKQRNYVTIHNDLAQSDNLSLEAKGLMLLMLSLPSDWTFRLEWLMKKTDSGRCRIRTILKELVKQGYLHREKIRIGHGRFDWQYNIFESPQVGCPPMEPPPMEDQPIYRGNSNKETGQSAPPVGNVGESENKKGEPPSPTKEKRQGRRGYTSSFSPSQTETHAGVIRHKSQAKLKEYDWSGANYTEIGKMLAEGVLGKDFEEVEHDGRFYGTVKILAHRYAASPEIMKDQLRHMRWKAQTYGLIELEQLRHEFGIPDMTG